MSAEIDELLDDEYAMQQKGEDNIQVIEIDGENEKKTDIEVSALLVDISETLRLLSEQMVRLNEVTKALPETVATLRATTEAVQCISNELPVMVRKQCLEEYKKILSNAVRNYNQMRKSADKWRKSIEKEREERFFIVGICLVVAFFLWSFYLILK